jgi:hypothetical protein
MTMDNVETGQLWHMLPALPYDYAALEPHIDARTMTLHHDKHHASYAGRATAGRDCWGVSRDDRESRGGRGHRPAP